MADLILLLAVALLSASQVLQKLGAQRRLGNATSARHWASALLSPELLGAGVAIVTGTTLWLYVLYQMDVSRAFPFLSLGSVVVVGVSRLFLGEHVSAYRWTGVLLITLGIALVART
jgi:drug/metabolite transporter (DMT)-like permease